jgi:DNA-directed RNA polymerase subunit K/omega
MPTKPKTLYTKTNPVDITNLLSLQKETTGKQSRNVKKNKKYDSDSEPESEDLSEDDVKLKKKSGGSKSKKADSDIEDDEEIDEEIDEEENTEEVDNDVVDADDADEDIGVKDESINESDEEEPDAEEDVKSVTSNDDKETVGPDGKCYSKYAKEEDIDLDEYFRDDDIIITKTGRVGKPILFKYERVRLLSDRARQLAEGAKPMIKNTTGLSHKEVALLELKNKLIPLIIERPIPNSGSERWRLSELEIPDMD